MVFATLTTVASQIQTKTDFNVKVFLPLFIIICIINYNNYNVIPRELLINLITYLLIETV